MKLICAWCGKTILDGELPVSHGMCENCRDIRFEPWKRKVSQIDNNKGTP